MIDERLRRAWRRTQVRGPIPQSDLDALDAELRRAGDGPWLPVPIRFTWYTWRQRFGRDVVISGRPVEIMPLESFAVTINAPPTSQTLLQVLEGLHFRLAESELITVMPGPHELPDGPLVEELT